MLTIDHDLLKITGEEFILDAGCGNGRHVWQAAKDNKGTSVAFDLDVESLQRAKFTLDNMDAKSEAVGAWHMVAGSILKLPFEDARFDKVICSEVLEHIPDDTAAVAELTRVLRPGGLLAVSVPSYFAESVCWKISDDYHNTPGGHIRIYSHQEIQDLLKKFDLTIFAIRYKHALHSVYWWSKGLFGLKNEKAFIPSMYYKFLVWDIVTGHKYTRWLEGALNHVFPKSTVLYCRKPEAS